MDAFDFLRRRLLRREHILLFTVALVGAAGNANATCDANSCTNQVRKVYTDNATTYIQLSGSDMPTTCTLLGGVYATLPASNPNYKALLSNILIAYTMNQQITLRYLDGSGGCQIAYLYLDKGQ